MWFALKQTTRGLKYWFVNIKRQYEYASIWTGVDPLAEKYYPVLRSVVGVVVRHSVFNFVDLRFAMSQLKARLLLAYSNKKKTQAICVFFAFSYVSGLEFKILYFDTKLVMDRGDRETNFPFKSPTADRFSPSLSEVRYICHFGFLPLSNRRSNFFSSFE